MNSRRLSAASGWISSKSTEPSTPNPLVRMPDGITATLAIRSVREDVVDHDRRLVGDGDEVIAATGEQASAYGTVAERDAAARSLEVETLPRYDDPRQRSPVGVDDLGAEDLDGAGAGHEVPPTQGARELAPPMSRHACTAEQIVVHMTHGEGIHVPGVERAARGDAPDGRLRTGDGIGNRQLVGRDQVSPAPQPPTQLLDAHPPEALREHLREGPLVAQPVRVEPRDLAVGGVGRAEHQRVGRELLIEPYELGV